MSYPRKKYIWAIIVLVAIIIIPLVIAGVSGYFTLKTAKYGMITTLLLGFFMYPLITKLVDWIDCMMGPIIEQKKEDAHAGRMGYEGEDTVFDWLKEIVIYESIFRNVPFSDRFKNKFDIDFVVVGQKGVIAIEVKNLTNTIRFEGGAYFWKKGNLKIPLFWKSDPRREATKHAKELERYLESNGKIIKVKKVLVFSNGRVSWEGKPGIYIAKDKESLKQCIDSLEDDPNCTPEVCEEIKSLLASARV